MLGISGSLRRDSHNMTLLRAAGELVEEHGAAFEVFDGLKAIPPYDQDDDVGATSPLPNKPVAVIGARVTEVELALGHAHEHLDPAGHLADPTQQEALRDSVRVLLGELENAEVAAVGGLI
ncbi:MAG: NAD(P)H-dependent oxidoreductase [Actinomycetota bacterium]